MSLRLKQLMRCLVLLLSIILCPCHILTVEIGKVVTPQGVACLYLLYGILNGTILAGHLIQYLFVEQFHTQPTCQFGSNLMAAGSKLATDGYNEFLFTVHKQL
jgi:hypothetical protein